MSDLLILRETLEITLARDEGFPNNFPARFYEHLFAAHPDIRPLFHRSSPGALHKMFAQKLTALVDNLDDPAWLARELPRLAANHVSYGVTAEMYPWVGEALIATLREACAERWTEAAEAAWRAAYDRLMQQIVAAT
ncbi:MAG TPA: globin domain-containing protein [Kofleriaceae bacterium]|nr:globin domain-containing protein [Kofleriaceae bacterium]